MSDSTQLELLSPATPAQATIEDLLKRSTRCWWRVDCFDQETAVMSPAAGDPSANAQFIAAARTVIPPLMAAVHVTTTTSTSPLADPRHYGRLQTLTQVTYAATPGPWRAACEEGSWCVLADYSAAPPFAGGTDTELLIASLDGDLLDSVGEPGSYAIALAWPGLSDERGYRSDGPDLTFAAAAHNDLPWLARLVMGELSRHIVDLDGLLRDGGRHDDDTERQAHRQELLNSDDCICPSCQLPWPCRIYDLISHYVTSASSAITLAGGLAT